MTLQVIVATMHQTDRSLIRQMNIQTDAVVVNQCDTDSVERFSENGHRIIWVNSTDRGVGKSRNLGILHSSADVLLFADEDVVYADGYERTVTDFFAAHPACSLAVFNLTSLNPARPEYLIPKTHRLRWYNCLRYGAARIAVSRAQLLGHNVWYSLLFGGGAPHQAGEDNLLITQCLQRGMRCMANDGSLGAVRQEESTWFEGYNEKYYRDRGALFYALYGRKASPILLLFDLKERLLRKKTDLSFRHIRTLEKQGIKDYRHGK